MPIVKAGASICNKHRITSQLTLCLVNHIEIQWKAPKNWNDLLHGSSGQCIPQMILPSTTADDIAKIIISLADCCSSWGSSLPISSRTIHQVVLVRHLMRSSPLWSATVVRTKPTVLCRSKENMVRQLSLVGCVWYCLKHRTAVLALR